MFSFFFFNSFFFAFQPWDYFWFLCIFWGKTNDLNDKKKGPPCALAVRDAPETPIVSNVATRCVIVDSIEIGVDDSFFNPCTTMNLRPQDIEVSIQHAAPSDESKSLKFFFFFKT